MNGTSSCSGSAEVFYEGEWLGLCPSWSWRVREAKVLCRELGFVNVAATPRGPPFEEGRGGVKVFDCRGERCRLLEIVIPEEDQVSVMVSIILM